MRNFQANQDAVGQGGNGKEPSMQTWLQGIQSQSQMPNALRDFVHPGKGPKELLMRTVFRDRRDVNAAVLLLHKIYEFKMGDIYLDLVQMLLSGLPSIMGLSRKELLQGYTGMLAPALYGYKPQSPKDKDKGKDEKA